jgi:hypothetical protein
VRLIVPVNFRAAPFGTNPAQTAVPLAYVPVARTARPPAATAHETFTVAAVVRTRAVIRNALPARTTAAALGPATETDAVLRVKTLSEPSSRPQAQLKPIGSTAETYRWSPSGLIADALALDSTCPCAHESLFSTSLTHPAAPGSRTMRPSVARLNASTAFWNGETA